MGEEKYSVEQVVRALESSMGLISPAARALGCSAQTVRNYVKRHPTVKRAKEDEREKLIDMAEASLYKQIKSGDTTAIIFTLKTVGKDRGYVERREVTGKDGGPLATKQEGPDLSVLTDEEFDAYRSTLRKLRFSAPE
jgi:hypothetical protein